MISPSAFLKRLAAQGVDLITGVPDSLLGHLCACIETDASGMRHIVAANEGNAMAIALGHHLATGRFAAVYMQNSGLGNAINPLTSLLDAEVYRVPALLLVGWRGEPGVPDEPQHVKQGRITPGQLELLGIPYWILDAGCAPDTVLDEALARIRQTGAPVALLIRKNTFARECEVPPPPRAATLRREEALERILDLAGDALVIATTGKTSRELFELRSRRHEPQRDFLTVGGMGHASSIALGVALARPERDVICLDGDGAVLMHMGALATIGQQRPGNLVHVLLNNASHESVGGQPTVADRIDFEALAIGCGYGSFLRAADAAGLRDAWHAMARMPRPVLLQIDIATGSRQDLGRPTRTPEENKRAFMENGA